MGKVEVAMGKEDKHEDRGHVEKVRGATYINSPQWGGPIHVRGG